MPHHTLKAHPLFFEAVWDGRKRFEVRRNDRDYQEGDILHIQEWDPVTKLYSGRVVSALASYILSDFVGLSDQYCIISLSEISKDICQIEEQHRDIPALSA
jgi:hypothetical protein